MKINKHFHTKHGQNTSTQNRSIVSQWHSHTHTHTSMCKRLFNKVFFTFSWMTTQNNYRMYTWHTFIRWPTTDMERASLTERFVAVKNTCFFFFNYTISVTLKVISQLKKKVLQMLLYFSMKYPIFQLTLNLFFIITTIISWIIQPSITTNTVLLGSSHLFS